MKEFLSEIINRPISEVQNVFKQFVGNGLKFIWEHDGNFLMIPDAVRRCHFLTSTEKDVLYELISWASTTNRLPDGQCKVTESHIRVNTNLGLSTVKKAIGSLTEKGFISKGLDLDRRNIYKINSIGTNPYVILSEWLFVIRRYFLTNISSQIVECQHNDMSIAKKFYIEATMEFVKDKMLCESYICRLKDFLSTLLENRELWEDDPSRIEIGSKIWRDIWKDFEVDIYQIFEKKCNKL